MALRIKRRTERVEQTTRVVAPISADRDLLAIPFDTADEALRTMDDLSIDQSAPALTCMTGGAAVRTTRLQAHAKARCISCRDGATQDTTAIGLPDLVNACITPAAYGGFD